jgi:hypothetical protein
MRYTVHGHGSSGPGGKFGIYKLEKSEGKDKEAKETKVTNFTLEVAGRVLSDDPTYIGHRLEICVRQFPGDVAATTKVSIFAKDTQTDHKLKQALGFGAADFQIDLTSFNKVLINSFFAACFRSSPHHNR